MMNVLNMGDAFGMIFLILALIVLIPLGFIFGFIFWKIRRKIIQSNKSPLKYYYSFLISFFLIFLISLQFFNELIGFGVALISILMLITLNIFFFKFKIKKHLLIASFLFILIIFSTFTSVFCKTTSFLCERKYCSEGTPYNPLTKRCVSNTGSCTDRVTNDCENNKNGKNLCEISTFNGLGKCVENVEICFTTANCWDNKNGKNLCEKDLSRTFGKCVAKLDD